MTSLSFLLNLMIPSWKEPRITLKPEDRICREFAATLIQATLEGRLRCCWTHIANENANNKSPVFGMKLRMLGKIPGVSDYLFFNGQGSWAIEVKEPKRGKLSPNQHLFKQWCDLYKVPYHVITEAQGGMDLLKGWGLLH